MSIGEVNDMPETPEYCPHCRRIRYKRNDKYSEWTSIIKADHAGALQTICEDCKNEYENVGHA